MWLDIVLRRLLLGLVGLVGLQVLVLRFGWYFDATFLGCLGGGGGALFRFGSGGVGWL